MEQDIPIHELVAKIKRREIQLPEMQRKYVWGKNRVRDLLDSLYREYPSGMILTWEPSEEVSTRDFSITQEANNPGQFQLLLDGQQRLTSLYAILMGKPIIVKNRRTPIEILFNLEHPEELELVAEVDEEESSASEAESKGLEDANKNDLLNELEKKTFVVSNKALQARPHWISVTEVFQDGFTTRKFINDVAKKSGIKSEDPRLDKYEERLIRLRSIKDYKYRVHVLERGKSYEEVTEIFVRVNSLGAKLRSSDLALAQITSKWNDSLKIFQAYGEAWRNVGFDLDQSIYLKNLMAFATGQSSFNTINRLSESTLKDSWEQAKGGMEYSLNFLRSNAKIESPALLSSAFIAITVAKYGHKMEYHLSKDEESQLRYWTLLANTKGRYSRGSSETLLNQDLRILTGDGNAISDLINTLEDQVGRLDILESDIENKNTRSAYFKTMFLAFKDNGAKDWNSQVEISIKHTGSRDSLQFHHIFPKSLLKGMENSKVNDICNLAFIGGATNRKISNKPPSEYLRRVVDKGGEEALLKQCVPTDPQLWGVEAYEDFLKERRKLVVKRLNDFLDHKWGSRGNSG